MQGIRTLQNHWEGWAGGADGDRASGNAPQMWQDWPAKSSAISAWSGNHCPETTVLSDAPGSHPSAWSMSSTSAGGTPCLSLGTTKLYLGLDLCNGKPQENRISLSLELVRRNSSSSTRAVTSRLPAHPHTSTPPPALPHPRPGTVKRGWSCLNQAHYLSQVTVCFALIGDSVDSVL